MLLVGFTPIGAAIDAEVPQGERFGRHGPAVVDRGVAAQTPAVAPDPAVQLREDSAPRLQSPTREVGDVDEVGIPERIEDLPAGSVDCEHPSTGAEAVLPGSAELGWRRRSRDDASNRRPQADPSVLRLDSDGEAMATGRKPGCDEPVSVVAVRVGRVALDPAHRAVD